MRNNRAPIIPRIQPFRQPWQILLANAIREPEELLRILELPAKMLPTLQAATDDFKLKIPQPYLDRIQRGNPQDPLLLQVLPRTQECLTTAGYSSDPVGDLDAIGTPGLIHKYHGRVLITLTGACAIHCRYCFRRHYPYAKQNPAGQEQHRTIDYLRNDSSIEEVILSGGDPLLMDDRILCQWAKKLQQINHIKILRIHSRLPVVLPQRIDRHFLSWISQIKLKVVLVLHTNHPQELDADVAKVCQKLKKIDITLLNQSVLLRGINDNADTLVNLSRDLFQLGVLPYYLHLLDKVQGAAHFDLPKTKALALHQALQTQLPGYLVPKLVQEKIHKPFKTLIFK